MSTKTGQLHGQFKVAAGFGAPGLQPGAPDITILRVNDRIDAALFEAEGDLFCSPVTFRNPDTQLAVGEPVATLGTPLPEPYQSLGGGEARLEVALRLAAGWISSTGVRFHFPSNTSPDLLHHELNLLGYPGISGAPLFDIRGQVVGMMRGTRLHQGTAVAAYAYADRLHELLEFLSEAGITPTVAGPVVGE